MFTKKSFMAVVFVMGMGGAVMETAASAPGISPGQLSFQVQVQVTYGIR